MVEEQKLSPPGPMNESLDIKEETASRRAKERRAQRNTKE
jgi:hypothetical protein